MKKKRFRSNYTYKKSTSTFNTNEPRSTTTKIRKF